MDFLSRFPRKDIEKFYNYIQTHVSPSFASKLKESLDIIGETFSHFKPENCLLSFNGGKDCTALLYLLVIFFYFNFPPGTPIKLKTVLFSHEDHFPEMEEFVEETKQNLHDTYFDFLIVHQSIKQGLNDLKTSLSLQGAFIGMRYADPNAIFVNRHFIPTTVSEGRNVFCVFVFLCFGFFRNSPVHTFFLGWPKLTRILPIFTWSFQDVWSFIRTLKLPYCRLYDQGYTSIGQKNNTLKNPFLKKSDCDDYFPAYYLEDENFERAGRVKSPIEHHVLKKDRQIFFP